MAWLLEVVALGITRYCYPLTITDFAGRYLLWCASRTDNGTPFASNSAFFGLSKLSVWWLRLGIAIERIKPGNPLQYELLKISGAVAASYWEYPHTYP